MLRRFEGTSGRRLLVEALQTQKLVGGNKETAEFLADRVQLRAVKVGEKVISQGDTENFILMILSGVFEIVVNEQVVARRYVNDHVGEMAAINPALPRAATVTAVEESVVAQFTEDVLVEAGEHYSGIYRYLAKELAQRLHQRNSLVVKPRQKVRLFIISSTESLPVAREIQEAFQHDNFSTVVWTDGVFRAGSSALENLMKAVDDSDFAVAIAHADDMAQVRGKDWPAPRDNVVFELGLFMGRLGKERAILMEPRERDVKLPSDMAGIMTITYLFKEGDDAESLMGPACNALRKHIKKFGPRS